MVTLARQLKKLHYNVITDWNIHDCIYHNYKCAHIQVTVSCGGRKMYPDCSYCFRDDQRNDATGCNGNCVIDTSNGKCVTKGIFCLHI